jgi:hypothetical protein
MTAGVGVGRGGGICHLMLQGLPEGFLLKENT